LALIYYAGHGAQINGENYLLPVDMEIPPTEADVELSSSKVDDLVISVRSTTKVIFLDARRDNPALFKNLVSGRGTTPTGLAPTNGSHLTRVKSGGGVFIAYATDAGSVALEGDGEHSSASPCRGLAANAIVRDSVGGTRVWLRSVSATIPQMENDGLNR
jgi:uncharacterized caspase-like protein